MTMNLPPEVREQFRRAGRRGGLTYAAQNDVHASTARASRAFAASWATGHGCKACGPRIEIPDDVSPEERERRAAVLKKRHYTAIADRRWNR